MTMLGTRKPSCAAKPSPPAHRSTRRRDRSNTGRSAGGHAVRRHAGVVAVSVHGDGRDIRNLSPQRHRHRCCRWSGRAPAARDRRGRRLRRSRGRKRNPFHAGLVMNALRIVATCACPTRIDCPEPGCSSLFAEPGLDERKAGQRVVAHVGKVLRDRRNVSGIDAVGIGCCPPPRWKAAWARCIALPGVLVTYFVE